MKTELGDVSKVCDFFRNVFCADSAKICDSTEDFSISGVIEITSTDHRGIFYIALVDKRKEKGG